LNLIRTDDSNMNQIGTDSSNLNQIFMTLNSLQ